MDEVFTDNAMRTLSEDIFGLLDREKAGINQAIELAGADPVSLAIKVKIVPTETFPGKRVETTLTYTKEKAKASSSFFIDVDQQSLPFCEEPEDLEAKESMLDPLYQGDMSGRENP